MTESATPATPEVSWDQPVPTLRTHTPTAEVETQLDDSFAAGYHRCACGAMIVTTEDQCYPCGQGNRARGPIYGASLAGPPLRHGYPTPTADITVDWQAPSEPAPGAALRAVEAVWITPEAVCPICATANERIDDLLAQMDALVTGNRFLEAEVHRLRGQDSCHDCATVADASEALQRELDTVTEYCHDVQSTVDDLNTENSALAGQVVTLKGQLAEAQCALTRTGKVRAEG